MKDRIDHAGIADQNIQPTEPVHACGHGLFHLREIADVTGQCDGLIAQ